MDAFVTRKAVKGSAARRPPAKPSSAPGWQRLFSSSTAGPSPATTGRPSCAASSSSSNGAAAASKKRPALEQTYLDLGQRNFGRTIECRVCGFIYAEGEPSDEAAHRNHHRKMDQGVRVRGALAALRVVSERDDGDRIVVLRPSDGAEAVRKLHEVRATLERVLGPMFSGSIGSSFGHPEAPPPLPAGLQAYLFLESHSGRVRGCAFAETITFAFRAVPPERKEDGGGDGGDGGDGGELTGVLQHDGIDREAMCGISHIWTDARDRRRGVARGLLDAVLQHFATGFDIPKDRLAFSQPTALGRRLAASYLDSESFLVYE